MSEKTYFAAREGAELAHDLTHRLGEWSSTVTRNGLKRKWYKSYRLYYGRHWKIDNWFQDSDILRLGDEGELAAFAVNHYRSLIKHILVLTTNQKPSFDVRAINSDLKSLQQAKLANNILESYLKEKRIRRYVRQAAEEALVFGKGFVKVTWEPSLGSPISVEPYQDQAGEQKERLVYEGDVDVSCPSVFDVYVDLTLEDWSRAEWVICRSFRNKFNLSTRYPQYADKILSLPVKSDLDSLQYLTFQVIDETADVPIYEFYHKRTDAMPNGRYMLFCDGDTVLYDGPMPYRKLPIFRITPGEILGTTEGYTDAYDLMGIQEAINVLYSTIFTNQSAFGVQSVLIPEGANLTATQISKGIVGLRYNPAAGEPKPLQLTQSPPEIFKNIEMLERAMETLSGVNSVARGNPESFLKSGVALGLVQSMAVQFASGFQESYAELLEDVGTFILDLLKDFARTERMTSLAGKWNRGQMAAFTNEDLQNVTRVIVDLGNPLARTTAGRVDIANNLLQNGLIKTPQEYINVMTTGQLDPMLEGAEAELALVRQENEQMMDGQPVQMLALDCHLLHIQEHKALLANPTIRTNEPAVGMILQHIQSHLMQYQTQNPIIAMVNNEPPAPPQMPPGGPPGPHQPVPNMPHNGNAPHPPQAPGPNPQNQ